MKIIERYSAAVNSDNLSSDERSTWSDSDVLGAAGLAAKTQEPLGLALTRFFVDGKTSGVVILLSAMAVKRARTMKVWLPQVQADDMAKAVLAWYRHGTCQPCHGIGQLAIPNTPALGEECRHCHGTGKVIFDQQFPADLLPLAKWLGGEIERSQVAAGRATMAMLAPSMELTK